MTLADNNGTCDVNASVDLSKLPSADHTLLPGMTPWIGEPIMDELAVPFGTWPIRIVVINGAHATTSIAWPTNSELGPMHDAAAAGSYGSSAFRYRFELCDKPTRVWHPITSPSSADDQFMLLGNDPNSFNAEYEQRGDLAAYNAIMAKAKSNGDPYPMIRATLATKDNPAEILFSYKIIWKHPVIITRVSIKHSCTNLLLYQSASNHAEAETYIEGHLQDGPYPVAKIGVTIHYFGDVGHGLNGHDGPSPNTGNPGAPGQPDYISTFPYGNPIEKSSAAVGFVSVDDNLTFAGIGASVCSDFDAIAVSKSYDGYNGIAQERSDQH